MRSGGGGKAQQTTREKAWGGGEGGGDPSPCWRCVRRCRKFWGRAAEKEGPQGGGTAVVLTSVEEAQAGGQERDIVEVSGFSLMGFSGHSAVAPWLALSTGQDSTTRIAGAAHAKPSQGRY